MPLPAGNVEWPPPQCKPHGRYFAEWGAWYSGDPQQLQAHYGVGGALRGLPDPKVHPSQLRGGVVGAAARFWWGAPPSVGALTSSKLHVPVAGDIAATSSRLLFGEPPTLTVADLKAGSATQQRLERICDDADVWTCLAEAAEIAAAYGGVYLRVSAAPAIADHPLLDAIDPDTAVPEWHGRALRTVTFSRVVEKSSGDRVWRHLERHEPGRVLHGLYVGDSSRLGRPVPLEDHPETEQFATRVDADGAIETGATGLAVAYVPNIRPHRLIRGSAQGRSDYAGVEGLMDALDEAYTSWMRDLRLAKGRLVVPRAYLQSEGPGQGASWDAEREIYSALDMLPGANATSQMLTPVQFKIRVEEHERTTAALFRQVTRGAGYSPSTFGEDGQDATITATEVTAREKASNMTRAAKIRYSRPPLQHIARTLLEINQHEFSTPGVVPQPIAAEWPDVAAPDPEVQARTLQLLDAAGAVSTRTKVAMLHPDWDETQIGREVIEIQGQLPNPDAPDFGADDDEDDLAGDADEA